MWGKGGPGGEVGAVDYNVPKAYRRRNGLPDSHAKVSEYADELMSVPRAHLALELRQDEGGLKLLHQDKPLVECDLTREGMAAAGYMAKALGAQIPPLGESVTAKVSTGVLFRAVSISSLDFSKEESFILLERWLEEAELQRGGTSDLS